jgi:hypothetical protein
MKAFRQDSWDHVLDAGWRHPLVHKGLPFVWVVWGLFLPPSFIHSLYSLSSQVRNTIPPLLRSCPHELA